MPRTPCRRWIVPIAVLIAGISSCQAPVDAAREAFRGSTPREAYLQSLEHAGLAGAALTEAWTSAGDAAVSRPHPVPTPYRETGWWEASEAPALGLRVSARRGQRIEVRLTAPDSTGVFVDLLRLPDDSTGSPVHMAAAGPLERTVSFEPGFTAEYIVRVQPELLRGGEYDLEVTVGGSLAFPVDQRGMSSILSFFGDIRDGGARDHHGVDIFAPRGTPVIAAAAGEAYRVNLTQIGGKVVWLRLPGSDRARLYYAHLDSQVVANGDRVEVGDTIGFVGNTGNARTTPPHLHFGIYRRGPEDPWPYLEPAPETPMVSPTPWRSERRVRAIEGADVVDRPSRDGRGLLTPHPNTQLSVLAVTPDWLRVRTPEGVDGFIRQSQVERVTATDPESVPEGTTAGQPDA